MYLLYLIIVTSDRPDVTCLIIFCICTFDTHVTLINDWLTYKISDPDIKLAAISVTKFNHKCFLIDCTIYKISPLSPKKRFGFIFLLGISSTNLENSTSPDRNFPISSRKDTNKLVEMFLRRSCYQQIIFQIYMYLRFLIMIYLAINYYLIKKNSIYISFKIEYFTMCLYRALLLKEIYIV